MNVRRLTVSTLTLGICATLCPVVALAAGTQNYPVSEPTTGGSFARNAIGNVLANSRTGSIAAVQHSAGSGPPTQSGAADRQAATHKHAHRAQRKTKPETLEAVEVTGFLGSLLRASATKQNSLGIVDSISAEEAGTFPDRTVAGALQRVPGVSVNRSQDGEPNQITVRGFGPSSVNVLLNGNQVASATFSRAFNFEVLPVQLLKQLVVYKTNRPRFTSGAIGATVNVLTWQPLDFRGWHATFNLGTNDSVAPGTFTSGLKPAFSGMFGNTSSNGKFGWLFSFNYSKTSVESTGVSSHGWKEATTLANPDVKIRIPSQLNENVDINPITRKDAYGAFEWRPTSRLQLSGSLLATQFNENTVNNQFGYFLQSGEIENATLNSQGTPLVIHYLGADQGAKGLVQQDFSLANTPSDQKGLTGDLRIRYRFGDGNDLTFVTSGSDAYQKQSGTAYRINVGNEQTAPLTWINRGAGNLFPLLLGNSSPLDADNVFVNNEQTEGIPNISDHIFENRIRFTHHFLSGPLQRVRVGVDDVAETKREETYQLPGQFICNVYCGFAAQVPADFLGVTTFPNFAAGSGAGMPDSWLTVNNPTQLMTFLTTPAAYDQISAKARAALLSGLAGNDGTLTLRPNPQTFAAIHELDKGIYASALLHGTVLNQPWHLGVGLRYVRTVTTSSAFTTPLLGITIQQESQHGIPTFGPMSVFTENGEYNFLLPTLTFKLRLPDNFIFHAAYSKTLQRPDLTDLSAAKSYDFSPGTQQLKTGNVDLKPSISQNYDLGLGWFFGRSSYASLDGFVKHVQNGVTSVTTNQLILGQVFQVTNPINLTSEKMSGIEATFNYRFSRLPGVFNGLGLTTNYTYVSSAASAGLKSLAGERFTVPDISNTYNVSLFYQKYGVSARLAYNWRQGYLLTLSGPEGQPNMQRSYGEVDLSARYRINKWLAVYFDADNINDAKLFSYAVFQDRPLQVWAFGRRYSAGITVKL